MPKKKSEEVEKFEPEPEVEQEHFTLGNWKGFIQYRCNYCPWDTLDGEAAIIAHYNDKHAPPPPKERPSTIQAYSKSGKPYALIVEDTERPSVRYADHSNLTDDVEIENISDLLEGE